MAEEVCDVYQDKQVAIFIKTFALRSRAHKNSQCQPRH